MAVNLEGYGYDNLGQAYRKRAETQPDADSGDDLREKALALAIDYHRGQTIGETVEATAIKFLAFLKGEPHV